LQKKNCTTINDFYQNNGIKKRCATMTISNCLFLPTSENPRGFSVWCVLAKLSAKPRNYS